MGGGAGLSAAGGAVVGVRGRDGRTRARAMGWRRHVRMRAEWFAPAVSRFPSLLLPGDPGWLLPTFTSALDSSTGQHNFARARADYVTDNQSNPMQCKRPKRRLSLALSSPDEKSSLRRRLVEGGWRRSLPSKGFKQSLLTPAAFNGRLFGPRRTQKTQPARCQPTSLPAADSARAVQLSVAAP